MKNTIVSALNFNILKTNLSKIASKEVKIYVFENYFLKKGVVQQLLLLSVVLFSFVMQILILYFLFVVSMLVAVQMLFSFCC